MNEIELQRIWDLLNSKYDLGTYTFEQFKQRMSVTDGRKGFYEKYNKSLNLGTYEDYEKILTSPKDGSNFLQTVTDKIKQAKEKVTTNTQQQSTTTKPTPQEKKVAPKFTSRFKTKKCDENTYPWTRGCVNNKIGQMNQAYFGDRYADTYGDELYMQLDSLGYFDAPGQKDGEITQYIYDGVMKDRQMNEIKSLDRKKVVKETVKNVLKERLNSK